MIYGIAGASGTGKTTLGKHVSDALNIPFVRTSITEMARKAGFEAVGSLPLPDRWRLQQSLLTQFEDMLDNMRGPVILDRTPVDLIGYLYGEIDMHSDQALDLETLKQIDAYCTKCQNLTATRFDRVFITNILPEYELAETRPGFNPAYQRHVHMIIVGSLITAENQSDVSLLTTNDLHQRIDIVMETIAGRLETIRAERKGNLNVH